jgi:hypothetical protein
MLRFSTCLLALSLLAAAWPTGAEAQVRRCVQPDGDVAYTDHQCAEIGAVEREAEHGAAGVGRLYRGGCPRTVQDLLLEMTQAIGARDVNHLASLYHWAGMSSGAANAVMDQLDALVQQPLVDIVPVMPPSSAALAAYGSMAPAGGYGSTPVAVRIEQTLADSVTPSRTVFGLHRYFGCLWIRDSSSG